MDSIRWFTNTSVPQAIELAAAEHKPLLVDFWSPTCRGCAKLFATTYPDPRVRRLLAESFVCIKYDTKAPNEWFRRLNGSFAHLWHPGIVVLDARLSEARRFVGFLPPEEFMAQLQVGAGLVHLYHGRPEQALERFELVTTTLPRTAVVPEAMYWAGVAQYRRGGGLDALRLVWERLAAEHPESDWANRADCLDVVIPPEGFSMADPGSVQLLSPDHRLAAG
ncbi:MAG TPA: thioredoxin fold domain-containing protein [Gemmatimonadaceae bacterium]|nr:thioredoxin fold domain-containing protein [Gemmatimonadaceae bacterium]